ncbi:unnamed protein product, partial [Tilletia controversa]
MDVDEDLVSDLDSQDEGSIEEGDLVAADLPLFVRGHDSSDGEDEDSDSQDEDIVDQDDARPEHPDGQDEAPRAEQDRQNNEPRSRYSQQLLDDLTGDYSPGLCPQGPPRASERLLSAADLSPSQQATLNQFRTFVRKDLTVDAYIETARNTEKAANGVKIMSKFKAAKFAKRITKLEENETFVASVIPGPKNPVNVDSFLYPIMQEFAKASKGHWLWDGNERQRFLWKAYLVFAAADQPGSQKINHMTGTSGFSGCRICHMVANYLPGDGQVTGYFPIKSTGSESDPPINADRPEYDPEELP